jgi:hypothetical protein
MSFFDELHCQQKAKRGLRGLHVVPGTGRSDSATARRSRSSRSMQGIYLIELAMQVTRSMHQLRPPLHDHTKLHKAFDSQEVHRKIEQAPSACRPAEQHHPL